MASWSRATCSCACTAPAAAGKSMVAWDRASRPPACRKPCRRSSTSGAENRRASPARTIDSSRSARSASSVSSPHAPMACVLLHPMMVCLPVKPLPILDAARLRAIDVVDYVRHVRVRSVAVRLPWIKVNDFPVIHAAEVRANDEGHSRHHSTVLRNPANIGFAAGIACGTSSLAA